MTIFFRPTVLFLPVIAAAIVLVAIQSYSSQPSVPVDPGTSIGSRETERLIQTLRTSLETGADNADKTKIVQQLAGAYLQKIRETADTVYYDVIDDLLDSTVEGDPETMLIRSAVASGRHHFRDALRHAESAVRANPSAPRYYGALSDAQIELGLYDEAAATLQTMVDKRPDFNSFSRIAHIREINGDIEGAKQALHAAIEAGSAFPENIAWAHVERGKLYFPQDLKASEREFNAALHLVPSYPRALQGLAKVSIAKNNLEEAGTYFEQAFRLLPIAEHTADLADFYAYAGDVAKSEQLQAAVMAAYRAIETNGVNVDLEYALFMADHDQDLQAALVRAERAYTARPSIDGADALSWVLYKNGKFTEAEKYNHEAQKLGSRNAMIYFHGGMIALANNRKNEGKKLLQEAEDINPWFSLTHATALKMELSKL